MEKQKEKQIAYESLVELTKQSDSGVYFSRFKILNHIKEKIEKETGLIIHYRAGYKENPHWSKKTKVDLDDVLPKRKTLPISLEELVKEGKVKKITVIDQGWENNPPYTFDKTTLFYYRAIL